MEIRFGSPNPVNHAILMEDIVYGEHILEYVLEAEVDGEWKQVVSGSAVGHKKIDRFDTIKTEKLRLRVLHSSDTPIIRNFSLFFV